LVDKTSGISDLLIPLKHSKSKVVRCFLSKRAMMRRP
jgi:hypothetical protein